MEQTPQTAVRPDPAPARRSACGVCSPSPGRIRSTRVEWELRDARIGTVFEQRDVEFPATWSQNATNIVAQKYFRGQLDSPTRERSVKQMVARVAGTIADWGRAARLLRVGRGRRRVRGRADATSCSTSWRRSTRRSGSTSGFEENPQCSACFILSVDDTMESILDWNTKEGKIFRGGSGLGHQPVEHPRVDGAADQGRHRVRARSRSCAAPTPGRARSSPAARRAARRRWSCSTSTTRTSASSSGARPRRRTRPPRCATPGSTCRSTATASSRSSTRTPTTRSGSPTSSCTRSRTTPTGT